MSDKIIKLKRVTIDGDSLLERFELELNDHEWKLLNYHMTKSWNKLDFGLEGVIVKHLRAALEEVGYKPEIVGSKLKFKKSIEN